MPKSINYVFVFMTRELYYSLIEYYVDQYYLIKSFLKLSKQTLNIYFVLITKFYHYFSFC